MKQLESVRLQDRAEKARRAIGRNLDKVRDMIPANDDLVEKQFLPAALELMETPPSPAGRSLIYAICSFFVIAVTWSVLGKVDLVATASGKVIPSGKVKIIQPLEIGVISKIDVTEGQFVHTGDLLVEIDPTGSQAEVQRLARELVESQIEAERLSVTAHAEVPGDDVERVFLKDAPAQADQPLVQRQLALLRSALSQQAATLAGIDSDIAQKKAEQQGAITEIEKLEQTLPLIRKRSQLRQQLIKEGYSSIMEASREQQNLIESEHALAEDKHKLDQSNAAIDQLIAQRRESVSKFSATTLSSLADAARKADDTEQQLIKAKDLASHRTLTAPVDGVVQQIAVHTVGGVVTPAQELMVVVPKGATLEVEAMIQNRDVGFVREGQEAELKLETFPFTRYGLLRGKVLNVSRDTVQQQQGQGKNKDDGAGGTVQSPQEPAYAARISLDRTSMLVDGKDIPLAPGMAVIAEIKTGRQRVIDYLLDPLRRYRHDSFQER